MTPGTSTSPHRRDELSIDPSWWVTGPRTHPFLGFSSSLMLLLAVTAALLLGYCSTAWMDARLLGEKAPAR